jgi:DNA-binding NarL/FixJ family response regulator
MLKLKDIPPLKIFRKPYKMRIIIADDHTIIREGLISLLKKHKDIEVMGEAEQGREAVSLTRRLLPDIVIMDVSLPDLNGIEATRKIKASAPSVKVLALSMHSSRQYVEEMLNAGAAGYLLKDCASDELVAALHEIMDGKTYLSPTIAKGLHKNLADAQNAGQQSAFSMLTPREREVMQMFSEGKTTREIALELAVSVKTVETHRMHIMNKLKIDNIAELTRYAIKEGITILY